MTLYLTGAAMVFGVLLRAFLKDKSTPKSDTTSWLVVFVGTLIWPLILPSMILKQLPKFVSLKLKYTN